MPHKPPTLSIRYDEGCLAAHALNQIGDRWALLVVRELVFTPKRFQQIRGGLPSITAGVLTARLAQLVTAGVVAHDAQLGIYALTDAGHGLLPVLQALCRWALTLPGHDPSRFISPTALMISMGVTLQPTQVPAPSQGRVLKAGFHFGKEAFEMHFHQGQLATMPVSQPDAPFVLAADGNAMAVAVYGTTPVAQLAAQGLVQLRGDAAAAQEFVDLFGLRPRS